MRVPLACIVVALLACVASCSTTNTTNVTEVLERPDAAGGALGDLVEDASVADAGRESTTTVDAETPMDDAALDDASVDVTDANDATTGRVDAGTDGGPDAADASPYAFPVSTGCCLAQDTPNLGVCQTGYYCTTLQWQDENFPICIPDATTSLTVTSEEYQTPCDELNFAGDPLLGVEPLAYCTDEPDGGNSFGNSWLGEQSPKCTMFTVETGP